MTVIKKYLFTHEVISHPFNETKTIPVLDKKHICASYSLLFMVNISDSVFDVKIWTLWGDTWAESVTRLYFSEPTELYPLSPSDPSEPYRYILLHVREKMVFVPYYYTNLFACGRNEILCCIKTFFNILHHRKWYKRNAGYWLTGPECYNVLLEMVHIKTVSWETN